MSKIVDLRIAELFAGNEEYTIVTGGVGSCVVIILYDPLTRIGGMAHAILPRMKEESVVYRGRDPEGKLFVKYADQAVDTLVEELKSLGANIDHSVAKLVGGAHMFKLLEGDQHGIGYENTVAARERLEMHHITLETEVVGGTLGRNVKFDCATGIVEVTTKV